METPEPSAWDAIWPLLQNVLFLILGIVGTAVYDRLKYVQGDYELWIDSVSQSMKKPNVESALSPLEYSVNGRPVGDPYEVELCIWSTGKKDIGPDRFNGEELVIKLGVPILSELDGAAGYHNAEMLPAVDPHGDVVIDPSVLRSDMAVRLKLVTDGEPSLDFNRPFLDTKVRSWFHEWSKPRTTRKAMLWGGIAVFALIPIAIVVWFMLTAGYELPRQAFFGPMLIGLPVMLVVGAMLTAQSNSPGRVLRRAKKALDRRIPGSLNWEAVTYNPEDPFRLRYPHQRYVRVAGRPNHEQAEG